MAIVFRVASLVLFGASFFADKFPSTPATNSLLLVLGTIYFVGAEVLDGIKKSEASK